MAVSITDPFRARSGDAIEALNAIAAGGGFIAPSISPSGTTVPTNGFYLAASNQPAFSVNGANAFTLGTTDPINSKYSHVMDFGSNDQGTLTLKNSSPGANGPYIMPFQDSASPAVKDQIWCVLVNGRDSATNVQSYG